MRGILPTTSTGFTRELVTLAWPIVGLNLSYSLMGLIDTAFMGRVSTSALAAAGLGGLVYLTFSLLLRSTGNGIVPFASRAMGARDEVQAGAILRDFLWLGLLLCLPAVLMPTAISFALRLMGPSAEVYHMATTFGYIRSFELPLSMVGTICGGFLVSTGDSRTPMIVAWVAVALNVFFNWVLVFGNFGFPALGLTGSAIGTAVAVSLQGVALIVIVLRPAFQRRFHLSFAWPKRARLRELLVVSAPMGVMDFVEIAAFTGFFGVLGRIGTAELAASQVANQIASVAFMPGLALGTATASLVGRQLGARLPDNARRVTYRGILIAVAFMGMVGLSFVAFGGFFAGLFTHDSVVFPLARKLLLFMAVYQVFDAVQIVLRSALIGAGDTRYPMLIAAASGWLIMVPSAYLFGIVLGGGIVAAWGGCALFLTVTAAGYYARFRSGVWAQTVL